MYEFVLMCVCVLFFFRYGFASAQYVSSLISGVAIFCVGAGLSYYHGITGLINPEPIGSLFWSYCILGGSLLTEGGKSGFRPV